MMKILLFLGIAFFLLLMVIPSLFISIFSYILSFFTGSSKQQKGKCNSADSKKTVWEYNAGSRAKNKKNGRKLFDKNEGEYVSFEEVDKPHDK